MNKNKPWVDFILGAKPDSPSWVLESQAVVEGSRASAEHLHLIPVPHSQPAFQTWDWPGPPRFVSLITSLIAMESQRPQSSVKEQTFKQTYSHLAARGRESQEPFSGRQYCPFGYELPLVLVRRWEPQLLLINNSQFLSGNGSMISPLGNLKYSLWAVTF